MMPRPSRSAARNCLWTLVAALAGIAPSSHAQDDLAGRVAAAQMRLAVLEQRAARVDDINDIENLQRSYGYYLDKMLWEHVIDLFADDATMEVGLSGVYVGKESIRRYLYSLSGGQQGPIEGELYDHLQLQPIVTVADDGLTAKGRWRAWILTGTSGSGSGGNWGEGPYENEYVKEDGVWKIGKLHWYATYYVPYEGGWLNSTTDAVRAYSEGRNVAPDRPPSVQYEPYPTAFIPPFHYENPASGQ
jgi:SnoaL-like domain